MGSLVLSAVVLAFAAGDERPSHRIEYRGKQMPREKFMKLAREVSFTQIQKNPKLIGLAVTFEATIEEIGGEGWVVSMKDRKDRHEGNVEVDVERLGEVDFDEGHVVRLYGIMREEQRLEVCIADLLPPGIQWRYELRKIEGGIRAGQFQRYTIDAIVKNTGKQPVKSIYGLARLYQDNSPNDELQEFELEDLEPGETRQFRVDFRIYNFQQFGATSVPKCELWVTDYEL